MLQERGPGTSTTTGNVWHRNAVSEAAAEAILMSHKRRETGREPGWQQENEHCKEGSVGIG